MRNRLTIAVVGLATMLAACSSDRIGGPTPQPAGIIIDGVDTELLSVTYVCRNTFRLTNGNDEAVTVDWVLNGTTTGGTVSIPAGGSTTVDAPFQQTLQLYYAGTFVGEAVNPAMQACPGDGGSGGGDNGGGGPVPMVDIAYVCRNIFRIDNPNDVAIALTWRLNGTTTGGEFTLAPNGTTFLEAPFQQTLQLFYEGRFVTEEVNPGNPSCPSDGIVDVRPFSSTNDVNLKSNGVLPVALLGNPWFDASTVDVATVVAGAVHVDRKPNGEYHYESGDIDGDGNMDLVVYFRTRDLFADGALGASSTRLVVRWQWSGTHMVGSDAVRIVH